MSGSDPQYDDNPAAEQDGQLDADNNFDFTAAPAHPSMDPGGTTTYSDREAARDGQSTFGREHQNNQNARHNAEDTNTVEVDGDDRDSVSSQFTNGDYLNVDNTTILEHNKMLAFESPSFIYNEAAGWNNLSIALYAAADKLHSQAETLAGTWESDGAKDAFLGRVGASTYSLREWGALANSNYEANSILHGYVSSAQTQMDILYKDFSGWLNDARDAEDKMGHGAGAYGSPCSRHSHFLSRTSKASVAPRVVEKYFDSPCTLCEGVELKSAYTEGEVPGPVFHVIKEYSDSSRTGPMSSADNGFTQAYVKVSSSAQVWRGLINSASADIERLFQIGMPGPGGVPGIPGGVGPQGAPGVPNIPDMAKPNMAIPNMNQMLNGQFSPQALAGLQNLMRTSQNLGLQQKQLAALKSAQDAMLAKQRADQLAKQLDQANATDSAAERAAQEAAHAKAQSEAAQAAANAQKMADTSGLQSALDRVQSNMPGTPGAPDVGTPMMGMPGFPGGPGMPGATGLPGMGAPGSPGAGAPMAPPMGRPGGNRAGVPSLPGRNAGVTNAPKSFASKVNIPGRAGGGPGGMSPGAKGGTPPGGGKGARPSIGGRATSVPQAPTSGTPGTPTRGMPRSLGGRNNDAVRRIIAARGQTGMKALGPGSGLGPQTGLAGRSMARPDKSENLSRARSAMRRTLQGRTSLETEESRRVAARNGAAVRAARQLSPLAQKQDEHAKEALAKIGLIDDYELFEVASAGNGIIARPESQGPVKKAGPALGTS